MPVVTTPPSDDQNFQTPTSSIEFRRKSDTQKWKSSSLGKTGSLPPNLISATNQQKVPPNLQVGVNQNRFKILHFIKFCSVRKLLSSKSLLRAESRFNGR